MEDSRKNKRTCIGCGRQFLKIELFRIVRTPDGSVRVDPTGRAAGRGAYVCSKDCLNASQAKKGFARALKTDVPPTVIEALAKELEPVSESTCAR